ncbi:MAG TPA: CPBP family intramembrane metalloprotease [Intrasporangiaceae bacterium]|nr:CPBP family intramembrane metalloprotease [Intrasporangiaceae bacterium]
MPPDAPDAGVRATWTGHPATRFVLFLLLMLALVGMGFGLFAVAGQDVGDPQWGLIQIASAALAYLVLVRVVERRRSPVELRLSRASGLVVGAFAGAILFLACFAVIVALGGYRIESGEAGADLWSAVFSTGVVAGVSEEILFRGVVYRLAEERLGTWLAVALSGIVFGLVHLVNANASWWGVLAIGLEAGLLFALVYALTRSLWIVIGLHAAWNIVQGPVLGIAVSGSPGEDGVFSSIPVGSDWLTGGAMGVEGSVLTVVVFVAASAALAVVLRRRGHVITLAWSRRRVGEPTPG